MRCDSTFSKRLLQFYCDESIDYIMGLKHVARVWFAMLNEYLLNGRRDC